MEEKQFRLICIKRVEHNKVVSFKENKDYEIDSIKPGMPGEGTDELIVIDELGNKHIVATDRERIWKRDKWFNEHFEIMKDNTIDDKFKSILKRYNKEVCPSCGKEIDRGDVCWNNPTTDGEAGGTPYCVIEIQCQACDTEVKSGISWYPGIDNFEDLVDCALEDIFED